MILSTRDLLLPEGGEDLNPVLLQGLRVIGKHEGGQLACVTLFLVEFAPLGGGPLASQRNCLLLAIAFLSTLMAVVTSQFVSLSPQSLGERGGYLSLILIVTTL